MQVTPITPQETMHLHEILTLKNTCAIKSAAARSSISDPELKKILNQDISNTMRQIQDIQTTLSPAIGCRSES
ncbi:hypothetical protein [Caproiciproducens sp. LBM24188]